MKKNYIAPEVSVMDVVQASMIAESYTTEDAPVINNTTVDAPEEFWLFDWEF